MKKRFELDGCLVALMVISFLALGYSYYLGWLEEQYVANRSPLRAEWDELCGLPCNEDAACSYVEEWEWRDTFCWGRGGHEERCESIFTSKDHNSPIDMLVGGKVTKIPGGSYIYVNKGKQPFEFYKGPVAVCPSERYPDK